MGYLGGARARVGDLLARRRAATVQDHLGPYVKSVIVNTGQGRFAVDLADRSVGGQLRHHGSYGLDEIERMRPLITPNARVLVVGAHVGTLVVPLSRMCGEVVAVEANPATFDLLCTNLNLNQADNVRPINVAASNDETQISFLLNTDNSGGSKRKPLNPDARYYYDQPREITVPAARLDDLLPEQFDVVIMDIEGSEWFALQGAQRIVREASALVIEFIPHHLQNVAGASVDQLLELIEPHFENLTVPSLDLTVDRAGFSECLRRMYDVDQHDDGLIFT